MQRRYSAISNFIKSFGELLENLWKDGKRCVQRPTKFIAESRRLNPAFKGQRQQDAMKYLQFLVQHLHEEVNKAEPNFPPLPYLPAYLT